LAALLPAWGPSQPTPPAARLSAVSVRGRAALPLLAWLRFVPEGGSLHLLACAAVTLRDSEKVFYSPAPESHWAMTACYSFFFVIGLGGIFAVRLSYLMLLDSLLLYPYLHTVQCTLYSCCLLSLRTLFYSATQWNLMRADDKDTVN
jgi:hypothetical protein